MRTNTQRFIVRLVSLAAVLLVLLCGQVAVAQTTAFSFQGKLTNGGNPASGNYDLQFKLYDTATVGTGAQQGGTLVRNPVTVSAGVFTVTLDFGANVFTGAARYLEIGVRPAGSGMAYTILAPRQQITSSPYAIQTLNATQLGGLDASRYVKTDASGNVGIGATLPVTKLDVRGHLTLDPGTNPIIYTSSDNAEQNRRLSLINSPNVPSASGLNAGGILVADSYGYGNPGKNDLIVKGKVAIGFPTIQCATLYAEGSANDAVLGSSASGNGVRGTSSNGRGVYGFSTNDLGVHGESTNWIGVNGQGFTGVRGIGDNVGGGSGVVGIGARGVSGSSIDIAGVSGEGVGGNAVGVFGRSLNSQAGYFDGRVRVTNIPLLASAAGVCFNAAGDLLQCGASSLRFKTNVKPFGAGLDIVRRLRPISFNWKEDGRPDIGLGAEDVARVEPSLTFTDSNGEVAGVKYERLNILLINAINEQQGEIEQLKRELRQLQASVRRTGRKGRR